jgi:hypothetical protein
MTSHAAYLVTLAENVGEAGAEHTLNALRMVRGVVAVEPVEGSYDQVIARNRRDTAWENALLTLIREGPPRREP